jgi:hypothetical protein
MARRPFQFFDPTGAKPYSELKNLCVWAKSNNGIPNHASDTFAVKAKSKKLGPMRGLDRFATG